MSCELLWPDLCDLSSVTWPLRPDLCDLTSVTWSLWPDLCDLTSVTWPVTNDFIWWTMTHMKYVLSIPFDDLSFYSRQSTFTWRPTPHLTVKMLHLTRLVTSSAALRLINSSHVIARIKSYLCILKPARVVFEIARGCLNARPLYGGPYRPLALYGSRINWPYAQLKVIRVEIIMLYLNRWVQKKQRGPKIRKSCWPLITKKNHHVLVPPTPLKLDGGTISSSMTTSLGKTPEYCLQDEAARRENVFNELSSHLNTYIRMTTVSNNTRHACTLLRCSSFSDGLEAGTVLQHPFLMKSSWSNKPALACLNKPA